MASTTADEARVAGDDAPLDINYVRIRHGDTMRIVTFYTGQPVHELRALLSCLFPGTTNSNGKRPLGVQRLADGRVVPLSSAAKFPDAMTGGDWDLLTSLQRDHKTQKRIIAGFLQDLFAHGHISPDECDKLNDLLNDEDPRVLGAYADFCLHRDARVLRDAVVHIASRVLGDELAKADAADASGVSAYEGRLFAFIEHLNGTGHLTGSEAATLRQLVSKGSAAILAAFIRSRERRDPTELRDALKEIAIFYQRDTDEQPQQPERPTSPTPYDDDRFAVFEELVRAGAVDDAVAARLRPVVTSDDPMVDAAFELFAADADVADLVDTLEHINAVRGGAMPGGDAGASADPEPTQPLLAAIGSLVKALADQSLISVREARDLTALAQHYGTSSQQVLVAAYAVYESDGDIAEFLDTCRRVLASMYELVKQHLNRFTETIQGAACFSDQAARDLVSMYQSFEPRVMAAWDVYAEDGNVGDLLDTLSRILRIENAIVEEDAGEGQGTSGGDGGSSEGAGEEAEDPEALETYLQVMHMVAELMVEEGRLDVTGDALLRDLVAQRRPAVLGAYDVYIDDTDVDELIDSLEHIVMHHQTSADEATCKELFDFVEALPRDLVSDVERSIASQLVRNRDPRIMAAYDLYFESQNVYELIDTLRRLIRVRMEERATTEAEQVEGDFWEDEGLAYLEQVLAAAVDSGMLTQDEAETLFDSGSDPRISAAIDLYADAEDWLDLCDSLRRIARVLSSEEQAEIASPENLALLLDQLELTDGELMSLTQLVQRGSTIVQAALEVYETDGDLEDLRDTLRRVAAKHTIDSRNAAREEQEQAGGGSSLAQRAYELLDHLCRQGTLTEGEARRFMQLVASADVVAEAAFELYEMDGDLDDLLDTLRRVKD